MSEQERDIWLCLSGGNALGAYHAGAYQAVSDGASLTPVDRIGAKVRPWPYCGSKPPCGERAATQWNIRDARRAVYFSGWGKSERRQAMIEALVSGGVPFSGGLHDRPDMAQSFGPMNANITSINERLSYDDYVREITANRLCLDLCGMGAMTYRFVELAMYGCPILAEKRQVGFFNDLKLDFVEWFSSSSELRQKATSLLDDDERLVAMGAGARAFWERYLSPIAHAKMLLAELS